MNGILLRYVLGVFTGILLSALSFPHAVSATLIGLSSETDSYYEIDPVTGIATFISSSDNDPLNAGLTYLNGSLYATDLASIDDADSMRLDLYSINLRTGLSTFVSDQSGDPDWHGLASDESAGLLYAIAWSDDTLKTVSPGGEVNTIGPVSINARGMAYDDSNGILYATNFNDDSLHSVDTSTGTSTLIGPTGVSVTSSGLAYDEDLNVLYMINGTSLYVLDVVTGNATLVGNNGVSGIDGLAWSSADDDDYDGLTNDAEVNTYYTNPTDADTDNDGLTDGYEVLEGFNPLDNADCPEWICINSSRRGWRLGLGL